MADNIQVKSYQDLKNLWGQYHKKWKKIYSKLPSRAGNLIAEIQQKSRGGNYYVLPGNIKVRYQSHPTGGKYYVYNPITKKDEQAWSGGGNAHIMLSNFISYGLGIPRAAGIIGGDDTSEDALRHFAQQLGIKNYDELYKNEIETINRQNAQWLEQKKKKNTTKPPIKPPTVQQQYGNILTLPSGQKISPQDPNYDTYAKQLKIKSTQMSHPKPPPKDKLYIGATNWSILQKKYSPGALAYATELRNGKRYWRADRHIEDYLRKEKAKAAPAPPPKITTGVGGEKQIGGQSLPPTPSSGDVSTQSPQVPNQPQFSGNISNNVGTEDINKYMQIIQNLMQPTPRELELQKQLNNVIQSRDLGVEQIREQPIPMHFITGQSAALLRQSALRAQPIKQALEMEKAKRQAALEVAKTGYDFLLQKQKMQSQPKQFTLRPGSIRYDASGRVIAQVPPKEKSPQEIAREQDLKMLTHGYMYVNTPALRDSLRAKGYEIVEVGGRTYAKPPKKTTKKSAAKKSQTKKEEEDLFNLFGGANQTTPTAGQGYSFAPTYPYEPPNPYLGYSTMY